MSQYNSHAYPHAAAALGSYPQPDGQQFGQYGQQGYAHQLQQGYGQPQPQADYGHGQQYPQGQPQYAQPQYAQQGQQYGQPQYGQPQPVHQANGGLGTDGMDPLPPSQRRVANLPSTTGAPVSNAAPPQPAWGKLAYQAPPVGANVPYNAASASVPPPQPQPPASAQGYQFPTPSLPPQQHQYPSNPQHPQAAAPQPPPVPLMSAYQAQPIPTPAAAINQAYSEPLMPLLPPGVTPVAPQHLTPTVGTFPNSNMCKMKSQLLYGLVVQPLAPSHTPVPAVNFGDTGVIRCDKCRTYINPYVYWPPADRGARWRCNLCGAPNDVPQAYLCQVDAHGRRLDMMERPELNQSTIEIIAPAEYMKRPPQPPTYLFVIDVSASAVAAGMLECVAAAIRANLDKLPGETRTQVGFITYNSSVHLYNLRETLRAPQQLVLPDLVDIFLPAPFDLLVNLHDSRHLVDAFLNALPTMFQRSVDVEAALGPALEAVVLLMQPIGGKCLVFASNLPSLGCGALKNRENARVLGTDNENQMLKPATDWYKNYAAKCSYQHLGFDLFCCASRYIDVATLAALPAFTGGKLHFYPGFHPANDATRFVMDVTRSLTREQGFEAVMRVRCSKGISIAGYYGHHLLRGADLMALPIIDSDSTFALELRNEENVMQQPYFTIQCALLYSTSYGERRIRVHTMQVPISSAQPDLFAAASVSAMTNLLAKQAVEMAITQGFRKMREFVQNRCLSILRSYRSSASQFTPLASEGDYPESLRALPLLVLSLLKHPAFKDGTDVRADERAAIMSHLMTLSVTDLDLTLRPRLLPLHLLLEQPELGLADPATGYVALPPELPLSAEHLASDGAYLVDNGDIFFIRVGRALSPEFVSSVFEQDPTNQQLKLRERVADDVGSLLARVHNILDYLRAFSTCYQRIKIVSEGDVMEQYALQLLIEDRTLSVMSYREFIQHIARSTAP